jgi:glycosyltransferase involved in cell wall biosynthesis
VSEPNQEPRVSVVVPVKNEAGNIAPLIAEIEAACAALGPFEIIYVNDGSTDETPRVLVDLAKAKPHLRVLAHAASCGQSAAVRSGARAAKAPIIVTIDGDGQNDPAYIPALVAALDAGGPRTGLAAGQRVGRKDTGFKRFQSRTANAVRGFVLKDGTRDTGCGLKAVRRDVYLALPYFDALHRFMPALVKRDGFDVALVDVKDRPRLTGVSNYGFFDRLWVGIGDLMGVAWLCRRRRRIAQVKEVTDHAG